jgi:hypothetical protein
VLVRRLHWDERIGPDNYDLPGYSGSQRFNYYRTRTEGHNTLTFNRQNQNLDAACPIIAFQDSPDRSHAVADLTSAYEPGATSVLRGIALLNGTDVLVQDEIQLPGTSTVTWAMHTDAQVSLDGLTARLTRNGQLLTARILSPQDAIFQTEDAAAPSPQAQQPNVHRLIIRATGKRIQFAVQFTPSDQAPVPTTHQPLTGWTSDTDLSESR